MALLLSDFALCLCRGTKSSCRLLAVRNYAALSFCAALRRWDRDIMEANQRFVLEFSLQDKWVWGVWGMGFKVSSLTGMQHRVAEGLKCGKGFWFRRSWFGFWGKSGQFNGWSRVKKEYQSLTCFQQSKSCILQCRGERKHYTSTRNSHVAQESLHRLDPEGCPFCVGPK